MPGDDEWFVVTVSAALSGALTPEQIRWELSYADARRFQLAYYFREGSKLRLRPGTKKSKGW